MDQYTMDIHAKIEAARPASDRNNPNFTAHDLMPRWLEAIMPKLYDTEDIADPVVWVKWFTPASSWTWYVTEYSAVAPDGTPRVGFGLVDGLDKELGYIYLDEVQSATDPMGLHIERDLYFTPCRLSELR